MAKPARQSSGDPEKSLLIKAVRYKDKDLQMPPNDRQLPDDQIKDLETWVQMGAPDPRTPSAMRAAQIQGGFGKAKKHWAFQPIIKPALPQAGRSATLGANAGRSVSSWPLSDKG